MKIQSFSCAMFAKLSRFLTLGVGCLALTAASHADATPPAGADASNLTSAPPELAVSTLRKFEPEWGSVYHGASLPEFWDDAGLQRQVQQFKKATGKGVATLTWYASIYTNGSLSSWRSQYAPILERARRMGAVSLVKFSTTNSSNPTPRSVAPQQITMGMWDAYFEEFADTIKEFDSPVFISINHEMNGNWYPYSEAFPGGTSTAADYVAMWRHIVDIFRQRGVTNVAWVWSPNVPDVGSVSAAKYYPGDDYVDWVGISFYSSNKPMDMDPIYRTYSQRKPFFITEWATAPEKSRFNPKYPGDVAWINQFFDALETRYKRVKAISWFDWNAGDGNYKVGRNPKQLEAYARHISKPRYLEHPEGLIPPVLAKSKVKVTREDIVGN